MKIQELTREEIKHMKHKRNTLTQNGNLLFPVLI